MAYHGTRNIIFPVESLRPPTKLKTKWNGQESREEQNRSDKFIKIFGLFFPATTNTTFSRSLCDRCLGVRGAVRNHGGLLSRAGHHQSSHGVLLPRSASALQGGKRVERTAINGKIRQNDAKCHLCSCFVECKAPFVLSSVRFVFECVTLKTFHAKNPSVRDFSSPRYFGCVPFCPWFYAGEPWSTSHSHFWLPEPQVGHVGCRCQTNFAKQTIDFGIDGLCFEESRVMLRSMVPHVFVSGYGTVPSHFTISSYLPKEHRCQSGERGTIALVERMAATKLLMDPNPQNLVSGVWAFRWAKGWNERTRSSKFALSNYDMKGILWSVW